MLPEQIAFGAVALAMVIAALRMVTTKNVVHAALYLVVVLAGVGALYVLLAAEFVFVVQIIVYIGAIVVLFLFGTMLTRAIIGHDPDLDNNQRAAGLGVALVLVILLVTVLHNAFGARKLPSTTAPIYRTSDIGLSIFSTYLIPFEVVSVLLLAALVGAVVIARRD